MMYAAEMPHVSMCYHNMEDHWMSVAKIEIIVEPKRPSPHLLLNTVPYSLEDDF